MPKSELGCKMVLKMPYLKMGLGCKMVLKMPCLKVGFGMENGFKNAMSKSELGF
jgi:hypothetical protein